MKKFYVSVGLASVALAIMLAPLAHAAEFIAPSKEDNGNVTVTSSQSHHNLYVAGGSVTLDGATSGDIMAAGGTIVTGGPVEQDATLAGGTIIVNSTVGGDLRVFGGTITINQPVQGDLVVFGGTVVIAERATIGGDLVIMGGSATVNGNVAGSVWANGGSITLNSTVSGAVKVRANQELVFGPQANVTSDVNYTGPKTAVVKDGAHVGTVNFQEQKGGRMRHNFGRLLTVAFVIKLLAYIIATLILLYVFRRPVSAVSDSLMSKPWINLLVGIIAAIVIPIAIALLLITFVGYYVAILLALVYILGLLLACLFAAIFIGALVIKWLTKKPLALDWQAVLMGTVLFSLLALIPVVGWLIDALLSLMAFGALLRLVRDQVRHS